MRRAITVVVILAIAAWVTATTVALGQGEVAPGPRCELASKAGEFRHFSAAVWDRKHWKRKALSAKVLAAAEHKIECAAGPGHRKAMERRWAADRAAFRRYSRRLHRLFINYTWRGAVFPSGAWSSLPELKPYVAAALAEAAGDYTGTNMPGWTMVQMSQGEGDLKPGSRSTDNGWGWLAITAPYGDSFGVGQLGGYSEMLNPVKNAYVAARMYGAMGTGAWYGNRFVTCWNCHYHGKFDIRDALGGLTFAQALRAS